MSRAQLVAHEMTARMIERRLAAGLLHRVHPNVYAWGHRTMSAKGWLMAAVLAGGAGAVASHHSAGWWGGLLERPPTRHHVTIRGRRSSGRIEFHHCELDPADVTVVDGVPVTTPERALLDVAWVGSRRELERALDAAERRRLIDMRRLDETIERAGRRRGVGVLKDVLATHVAGSTVTASELEERALAEFRKAGLPQPLVNAQVDEFRVDFLFAAAKLAVEVDGEQYHGSRARRTRDKRRDRELFARHGIVTLRFEWDEVVGGEMREKVAQLLS